MDINDTYKDLTNLIHDSSKRNSFFTLSEPKDEHELPSNTSFKVPRLNKKLQDDAQNAR